MPISDTFHNLNKLQFKRELRRNMTEVEKLLWGELRGRKLEGSKWRRQTNVGPFIADFRCPEHHLIVEVDGKIHEQQKEYDDVRTVLIGDYNERVLRFTNEDVLNNMPKVLERISEAMKRPHPPSPSPKFGEGVT